MVRQEKRSNTPTSNRPKSEKRRKKSYGQKSKQHRNKQTSRAFTSIDLDRIEDYLTQYYNGVHHTFSMIMDRQQVDDNDDGVDDSMNSNADHPTTHGNYWIGGHEFPALTPELFKRPYLALPSTLQPKHRRLIYEICSHVGLYHTGVGKREDNSRHTIVSVYTDGLEQYGSIDPPPSFPIFLCKPWYHRNDHVALPTSSKAATGTSKDGEDGIDGPALETLPSDFNWDHYEMNRSFVREATEEARGKIQEYINYPSTCLRPSDTYDYFTSTTSGTTKSPEQSTSSHIEAKKPIMIDTPEEMEARATELCQDDTLTELAFDLEAYNYDKYRQHTCLIQLSTSSGQDYVIDVLSKGVWNKVSLLQPVFANPQIVKIGHGISSLDVPCLFRDFGIAIVNVFDTLEAAKKIPALKKHLSLAKLSKYYSDLGYSLLTTEGVPSSSQLKNEDSSDEKTNGRDDEDMSKYVELKSQYQNANWWQRPLKLDMIEYGLRDVRYLIRLRRILISSLIQSDKSASKNLKNDSLDAEDELRTPVAKNRSSREDVIVTTDGDIFMDCVNTESVNDDDRIRTIATPLSRDTDDGRSQPYYNNALLNDENDVGYFTPTDEDDLDIMEGLSLQTTGTMESIRLYSEGLCSIRTAGTTESINLRTESNEYTTDSSLQYNMILMQVLKSSQQSCAKLYNDKTESPMKSDVLSKLICRAEDQADSNNRIWDESSMALYEELIQWRDKVAKMQGIPSPYICSLDLLVWIAYKRPKCRENVLRLCYFLPECLLQDFSTEDYLQDLLSIIESSDTTCGKDDERILLYKDMVRRDLQQTAKSTASSRWFYPTTTILATAAAISVVILAKQRRK